MTVTPQLQELVRDGEFGVEELRRAASASELKSLSSDGIAKVLNGITTIDEILSTTSI